MGGWSPQSATNAYLDTLKLRGSQGKKNQPCRCQKLEGTEFISALAAGMSAKLIVEVSNKVSPSTIALAAAARQTGGRLVCILPESKTLAKSKQVVKEYGLKDMVEFKVGDPTEVLSHYENIDFSLIDCKTDDYTRLLKMLDVNPRKSVVVANNLEGERKGLGGDLRRIKGKGTVRSIKHPIGEGMEVTMIGSSDEFETRDKGGGGTPPVEIRGRVKKTGKSKWVKKVDEQSGEEHIYRVKVPNSL
ncbi:ankyrin repeat/KH domain protein [Thalictrum thalictroides]|uniref:Ankyrin repeat/KH domain protein n=1 Tax=Thalictrum thalictroides TaxID=46969 RepID=A0A7J6VBA9_THATH|nr:ankyrin repeat/KH domain protein [Thalictrum thalictroides]